LDNLEKGAKSAIRKILLKHIGTELRWSMKTRLFAGSLLLAASAAVTVMATGPSGAPREAPASTSMSLATVPAGLRVRMYTASREVAGTQPFSVIVEVLNETQEEQVFLNQIYLDIELQENKNPNWRESLRLPSSQSDYVAVVLRMVIPPSYVGMKLNMNGPMPFAFLVLPKLGGSRSKRDITVAIEPQDRMLGIFELSDDQIHMGANTLQATLVKHGQVIAKGDVVEVRREPATTSPSEPTATTRVK
jgi:hypothetical protein